ncbi:MAG: DNA-3-methyladenine glycosylase 2 family protein [Saprospiraceae bacterium]|nr:DNA-3-methyladenine glycosylase 2 family protein [Saprospiraceae bacterium]
MKTAASQHFQHDPLLSGICTKIELEDLTPQPDALYTNLISSVLSQQLSAKAADTILGRFLKLFPNDYPAPELLRNMDDTHLRTAGVSRQKAGYLRNIAVRFDEEDLVHADWSKWDDEEILAHLTRIKGVGNWTAEMILMFTLARPDVFPTSDMGIQSAIASHWDLPEKGKPRIAALLEIAESWRPYRSLACRYLWRAKDTGLLK